MLYSASFTEAPIHHLRFVFSLLDAFGGKTGKAAEFQSVQFLKQNLHDGQHDV